MRLATKITGLKIPELNGIKIERDVRAVSQKTRIYFMGWSELDWYPSIGLADGLVDTIACFKRDLAN